MSCAGPYGHYLLKINDEESEMYRKWVGEEPEVMMIKPGWARINLHYTLQDYEMEYLLKAMEFLNDYAWRFLTLYVVNAKSGSWYHKQFKKVLPKFDLGELLEQEKNIVGEERRSEVFEEQLKKAVEIAMSLPEEFELDMFEEISGLVKFYAAKGNVENRDAIDEKLKLLKS